MVQNKIDKLLQKINGAFRGQTNDANLNEFNKFFENKEYKFIDDALNNIIENGQSFIPSIAELLKEYKLLRGEQEKQFSNQEFCYICENKGVILTKKKDGTVWVYHCICELGKRSAYDGSKCSNKKNRSEYKIQPITSVCSVDEIRQINISKNRTVEPMPDYVRKLCEKHGMNIKIFNTGS